MKPGWDKESPRGVNCFYSSTQSIPIYNLWLISLIVFANNYLLSTVASTAIQLNSLVKNKAVNVFYPLWIKDFKGKFEIWTCYSMKTQLNESIERLIIPVTFSTRTCHFGISFSRCLICLFCLLSKAASSVNHKFIQTSMHMMIKSNQFTAMLN